MNSTANAPITVEQRIEDDQYVVDIHLPAAFIVTALTRALHANPALRAEFDILVSNQHGEHRRALAINELVHSPIAGALTVAMHPDDADLLGGQLQDEAREPDRCATCRINFATSGLHGQCPACGDAEGQAAELRRVS